VEFDSLDDYRKREIPFGRLRAGSRPAGENAGLGDDLLGEKRVEIGKLHHY
jgi:hypothetical protein